METAPVWFYNNVLKDTLEREVESRKANIENTNKLIPNIPDIIFAQNVVKEFLSLTSSFAAQAALRHFTRDTPQIKVIDQDHSLMNGNVTLVLCMLLTGRLGNVRTS